ncbi:hypothetical protein AW27_023570 [Streptomyces sp. PCS3-D2]|uniref:hypothetical protein n=1 Tax=Streptomyces sp. PCS3-D2 TaxID=1460244 RepID=UPI000451D00E|nr:hypothetical protein [Streptomyces sp. PCS3-D2]WKV74224.1 hypothetical protein AW27_023570 [Streptomyces sp. PCS3-D2]
MAALSLHALPVDGGASLTDNLTAAEAGGDTAPTGTGRFLVVANGSGGSITATLATPGTVSGLDIDDAAVVVAAGKTSIIPLSRAFAGANGRAAITYSAVTSLTVGAFELGT